MLFVYVYMRNRLMISQATLLCKERSEIVICNVYDRLMLNVTQNFATPRCWSIELEMHGTLSHNIM